mgnify:CR=1 FL=1
MKHTEKFKKRVDFETGEIIDEERWQQCIWGKDYDQVMYEAKWSKIREKIIEAEKNVKYHHRVDKKVNRGLCNQTIYGTRIKDGKIYKICGRLTDCKPILTKKGHIVWYMTNDGSPVFYDVEPARLDDIYLVYPGKRS